MSNEILTEIKLDLDKLRNELREAKRIGEKTGKESGQSLGDGLESGLSKAFGGIKGKILALGATVAGAFTFREAIKGAIEQENAINALNSAMAITGTYTEKASKAMQDYAASLQKTTVYGDEVILQGAAMLTTIGRLSGENLQRATKASLDFATALNIDVNSAFQLVAKAASGNVSSLSRYGVQIKSTGDQAQDMANVLNALEKRFGGLAALQTGTFAGATKQATNLFGDLLEVFGNIIIQSPTVIKAINGISIWLEHAAISVQNFVKNKDLINEIGKAFIKFGFYVNQYLVLPLELAYNLLKTGALAIGTSLTGLISIIALVGQSINDFLIKPLIDFIGAGLGKLISIVDKDLGASIQTFAEQSTASISQGLQTIQDQANAILPTLSASTSEAASKVFEFDVAAVSEKYLMDAQTFFDTVTPPTVAGFKRISDESKAALGQPTFFSEFAAGFMAASTSMIAQARRLGEQIRQTVSIGITNSFAAMGAALVKGESGFAAFGKAMLGVLGDVAIQFGSFFIGIGIGKTLLFDPTGPLLIAAGAALAVLGGALKALSGGGGGIGAAAGAGGGGGGGGVAAGGGAGVAPAAEPQVAFNEIQRGEVGTAVTVNVSGGVYGDKRQAGLEIADAINEAFGSNGVVATGVA